MLSINQNEFMINVHKLIDLWIVILHHPQIFFNKYDLDY